MDRKIIMTVATVAILLVAGCAAFVVLSGGDKDKGIG